MIHRILIALGAGLIAFALVQAIALALGVKL